MARLMALSDALARLGPLRPVAAVEVEPARAVGAVAAVDVVVDRPMPPVAEALIGGIAVDSAELVGASPSAPALLMARPTTVAAGDPLPAGCDAVVPDAALSGTRAPFEIGESAYPGLGVRLHGADVAAGTRLATAGTRIAPRHLPVLDRLGRPIAVRRVRVGLGDAPEASFLRAALNAYGVEIVDGAGDLFLCPRAPVATGIALRPGEDAGAGIVDGVPTIRLPTRIDGLIGALHALVLPALDALCGAAPRATDVTLALKLVSQVGSSDVALLTVDGGTAVPLAVGDLPLSAIAAADAFAVLPPASEGLPAGARLAVRPVLGHALAP